VDNSELLFVEQNPGIFLLKPVKVSAMRATRDDDANTDRYNEQD
jgi:hypothetical protein